MTTITKAHIAEVKSLAKPPQLVINSLEAVFLLLGYSFAESGNFDLTKKLLAKTPEIILSELNEFQAGKCDPASVTRAKILLTDVTVEKVKEANFAASHFVNWALKALEECEAAGKLQNTT
ncbi:uncharacterized protein LOC134273301 [Saccostrea cucullata]|uniref:uncharacterized protein LOC134273301 n=1 Tax=Saccostrea cuccullata TaxID=36930 RepID=UPI002ECFF530